MGKRMFENQVKAMRKALFNLLGLSNASMTVGKFMVIFFYKWKPSIKNLPEEIKSVFLEKSRFEIWQEVDIHSTFQHFRPIRIPMQNDEH